ncbi:hypothetical protein [Nocardia sp. alder85J]|uniref:hypothetical protein n=1 Tax=Nocardia sp. alder85J TaxID=2862949 RepID=UPI001CD33C4A|nr:hypothetical protein [Nocardia sp. alder85J]MCX4096153.1 hypothetical protein [Nocardia sp. alder85J]
MATIGQLRAALAVLRAEVDDVAHQVSERETSGADSAGVQHAMLAGLLYRLIGADLRRTLTAAPDLASFEHRARAATPSTIAMRDEDLYDQAHFEAYWLTDRIAELHSEAAQAPPLAAAAHTAEATRALLRIQRDLAQGSGAVGHPAWESVLTQLDRARALARAAHAAAETTPQERIVTGPQEHIVTGPQEHIVTGATDAPS